MLFYPYALVNGEWVPLGNSWVSVDGAMASTAAGHRLGATAWGAYIWDGWNMSWSVGV